MNNLATTEETKELSIEQKEKDLTVKQRRWLLAYVKCGNATQAVIDAGYDVKDRDSAAVIGFENLRKLNFIDFLEEMGISDTRIAKVIDQGLDATKEIAAMILIDKDGNAISKENEGQIQVADFPTRLKFVEAALKLKGRFKGAEVQILNQNIQEQHGTPSEPMGIEFVSYRKHGDRTNEELHKDIEDIQKILKERKDLKLEDHTEQQVDEIFGFDDPKFVDEATKELKIIKEAEIIEQPQEPILVKESPKEKINIKKVEDPQATIDKKKQAALQVAPIQQEVSEPYHPPANDISKKNWGFD